jgi:signal peptidase I
LIYRDPDIPYNADQKFIQQLNDAVRMNPSYPIPEGYYKTKEQELNLYYEIPEYYNIRESQKVCTEIIDDLCNDVFGFHILEPIARLEYVPKVKPSFKKIPKPTMPVVNKKKLVKRTSIEPLRFGQTSPRRK